MANNARRRAGLLTGLVVASLAALPGARAATTDAAVNAAETPVTAYPFQAAFHAPTGKKVVIISCGSIGVGCQLGAKGAQEAGNVLGWKTTIVDGKFDPRVWDTAVQEAVAGGADGIIMMAVSPALIQGGLDRARAAKVPVITTYQPKFPDAPVIDGYVTSDHAAGGAILAQWIIADSGGKAHVLILGVSEFPEMVKRNNALAAEFGRACPGCTVERQQFGAALAPQRLAPLVTAQLRQHPEVDYVIGPYDATGTFIAQGVRQAQKAGKVKYAGFEGNPIGFELMQNGEQAADLALPSPFAGWLAVDMLARKLAGVGYTEEVTLPQRLFVAGKDAPKGNVGWDTDFDYRADLQKLWLK